MPTRLRVTSEDVEVIATVDGNDVRVEPDPDPMIVTTSGDGRYLVQSAATRWAGVAAEAGATIWVSVEGEVFAFEVGTTAGRSRALAQEALMAPMPATVVRLAVAPGQTVRQGDLLISLEAMKMELPIRAPRDGVVRELHCREGERVQPGTLLVTM